MKMEVNINPVYEFQAEIDCIKSRLHQEILLRALQFVPNYFWVIPASSSGKYHPKGDLGIGGTLRHTKAVFWLGEELLSHRLYAPFDDVTKDDIRVALLLHDAVKQGTGAEQTHTMPDHPLLVRETLKPWKDLVSNNEIVPEGMVEAWGRICDLVETHMGIWTKDREGKEILCEPETKAQQFVHMCDYIASRKIVEVDISQRLPQANYNTPTVSTAPWRELVAKQEQIDYIKILAVECNARNLLFGELILTDSNGQIVIKRGEASDTIQRLKALLGKA